MGKAKTISVDSKIWIALIVSAILISYCNIYKNETQWLSVIKMMMKILLVAALAAMLFMGMASNAEAGIQDLPDPVGSFDVSTSEDCMESDEPLNKCRIKSAVEEYRNSVKHY